MPSSRLNPGFNPCLLVSCIGSRFFIEKCNLEMKSMLFTTEKYKQIINYMVGFNWFTCALFTKRLLFQHEADHSSVQARTVSTAPTMVLAMGSAVHTCGSGCECVQACLHTRVWHWGKETCPLLWSQYSSFSGLGDSALLLTPGPGSSFHIPTCPPSWRSHSDNEHLSFFL